MAPSTYIPLICCFAAGLLLIFFAILYGRYIFRLSIDLSMLRSEISRLKREKEELIDQIRTASIMLDAVSKEEPKTD